ncbi:MAG: hypothetical protein II776_06290 [Clostridia bacterium]|nr:hypothetical protein [Clostridia bacterium]
MKKVMAWILALATALSLAACAEAPRETKGSRPAGEDLTKLSATELYARAADRMDLVSSYVLDSVVTDGKESWKLETRRTRAGYDRITFSQVKNGGKTGVYFDGERATLVSETGAFSAPATTVTFSAFRESRLFPVCGLNMEDFVKIERDGMTVRYGEAGEAALSAFAALGDLTVTAVSGEAVIDPAVLIAAETITVTGTAADGAEKTYTIKTTLIAHDQKDLTAAAPPENVMQVNDIRLPDVAEAAREGFLREDAAVTLVDETELKGAGGNWYHFGTYFTARIGSDWSVQETFVEGGTETEEVSRSTAALRQNGALRRAVFDTLTGEKLSDETVLSDEGMKLNSGETMADLAPALSDLTTAAMSEESESYSLEFTLTGEKAGDLAKAVKNYFPVAGSVTGETLSASGAMAVRKSDGALISLSMDLTVTVEGGFTLNRRISLSADREGVALAPVAPAVEVH